MFDFYSATIFLSVFIMIIMDMLVSGNDLMEHDKKQIVYTISVLVVACMVSEWFGVWMDGADPSLRTLHILVKTIELSTAPVITVLCSDLMTPLKHKKLIYTLIGVHAGLEVLSAFFGFIFSVDAHLLGTEGEPPAYHGCYGGKYQGVPCGCSCQCGQSVRQDILCRKTYHIKIDQKKRHPNSGCRFFVVEGEKIKGRDPSG